MAAHYGGNYGLALAMVAAVVAVAIAGLTALGSEAKGVDMAAGPVLETGAGVPSHS